MQPSLAASGIALLYSERREHVAPFVVHFSPLEVAECSATSLSAVFSACLLIALFVWYKKNPVNAMQDFGLLFTFWSLMLYGRNTGVVTIAVLDSVNYSLRPSSPRSFAKCQIASFKMAQMGAQPECSYAISH